MAIPIQVLMQWWRKGPRDGLADTHEAIQRRLSVELKEAGIKHRFYRQGSYSNRTYIRQGSDVDLVVSVVAPDLFDEAGRPRAPSQYKTVRDAVRSALQPRDGEGGIESVRPGNKVLHVRTAYMNADVLVALQLDRGNHDSPVMFWQLDGEAITTYPWMHRTAISEKSRRANGLRPAVRMFKSAKAYLAEKRGKDYVFAPSYYVECLVWNAPGAALSQRNPQQLFEAVLDWMIDPETEITSLRMPDGQRRLVGESAGQWSETDAEKFIDAVASLWDNYPDITP